MLLIYNLKIEFERAKALLFISLQLILLIALILKEIICRNKSF